MNAVRNNLQLKGLSATNTFTKIDAFGTHSESYWRTQFGALYQWLFANETLSTTAFASKDPKIIQTLSGKIFVEGLPKSTTFELYNLAGAKVDQLVLSDGTFQLSEKLAKGFYVLKQNENIIKPIKIIKK